MAREVKDLRIMARVVKDLRIMVREKVLLRIGARVAGAKEARHLPARVVFLWAPLRGRSLIGHRHCRPVLPDTEQHRDRIITNMLMGMRTIINMLITTHTHTHGLLILINMVRVLIFTTRTILTDLLPALMQVHLVKAHQVLLIPAHPPQIHRKMIKKVTARMEKIEDHARRGGAERGTDTAIANANVAMGIVIVIEIESEIASGVGIAAVLVVGAAIGNAIETENARVAALGVRSDLTRRLSCRKCGRKSLHAIRTALLQIRTCFRLRPNRYHRCRRKLLRCSRYDTFPKISTVSMRSKSISANLVR